MRLTENRRIGAALLAVCALISVFGFGGWKLRAERNALEKTFIYGTETRLSIRHSMDAYLDRCVQSATDLAQEAKRYLSDTELIESVLANAQALGSTDGMKGRYDDYLRLTKAVEDLYTELQIAGAADEVNVTMAYGDYGSAQNLIKNDGYHAKAADFNQAVGAFPANAIATLWGVGKADTFGR